MTELSLLKWTHRTHQGAERAENKDYFSIIESDLGTWIFVIDVSTSSNATTMLAKQFCENFHLFLQDFLKRGELLLLEDQSQEKYKWLLRQAFNATKKALKIGVASFLSLHRSEHSSRVFGFCAGDCRLGLLNNKTIQWLSPVHTGANPLGNEFEHSMVSLPERHILSKSLNLRRKFEPVTFELETADDDIFVIATDGFWMELNEVQQQTFINEPSLCLGDKSLVDDTSVLLVTWSELEQEFTPKFECNLSSEFKTSSNNLKIENDNLLVISCRNTDFSSNANIAAMATKTESNNE
jgi:serine/threonine protein phosphatase PrpC